MRANRNFEIQQRQWFHLAMLEQNISANSMRLLFLLTSMLPPTVLTADGVSVRYKEGVQEGQICPDLIAKCEVRRRSNWLTVWSGGT